MKKSIFLLVLATLLAFDSPEHYTKVVEIKANTPLFTTDNMGNVFLAKSNGDLLKYNRDGDSLTIQNYKRYGKLESIDASNPFEIYLFYKDLNTVLLVDNQLTLRSSFDLENLEMVNVSATARSADNGLWLYDLSSNRLKKYNKQQDLEIESVPSNFYSNSILSPFQIIDKQNQVFVCDSSEGIFVFDNYGIFYKRLPIRTHKPIQIEGENLIYATDSAYTKYSLKNFKETILPMSKGKNKYLRTEKDRLYLLEDKKLQIFAKKEEKK